MKTSLLLATALALTACGTAPTMSTDPGSYEPIQAGTFKPADQARFVDCVFDGFVGAQNMAMSTHVRQTKRATGYRIDVIAGAFQYVVADVGDDGRYQVTRSTNAKLVNFDKEQEASRKCLASFGTVTLNTPPTDKSANQPYNTGVGMTK